MQYHRASPLTVDTALARIQYYQHVKPLVVGTVFFCRTVTFCMATAVYFFALF